MFSPSRIPQVNLRMPIPHVRMPTVFSKELHCFNCEHSFRSITLVRLISSRLEVLSCQIYTNHNSKKVQSLQRRPHAECQLLHRRLQCSNNNNDYDDDDSNNPFIYIVPYGFSNTFKCIISGILHHHSPIILGFRRDTVNRL